MQLFKKKKPLVGVALSGGGLRGVGHLGALKALDEYGLKPSILSGTSAGAIAGAFYAAGYTPDEMLSIVLKTTFFSRSAFRFRTSGIFDPGFLQKLFKEFIPENDFAALKIPLYIAATEITGGLTEYFHEGALDKALLASTSIPFIFPSVKEGDKVYLDGGIMNNLPIEPIADKCDLLIGVHVNSIAHDKREQLSGRKMFDRIVHLAIGQPVYDKSRLCNIFIDPPGMTRYSMFDKKDSQKVFDLTYDFTIKQLEARDEKRSRW